MITAGEPQEFIPLGREHLKVHPGDVYLPTENVPAAPSTNDHSLTRDLLKALRGVTLKDQTEVLWTEFRIRSCKPRIVDSAIEMEDSGHEALCGICIVENSSLSVFATSGEDYIVTTPFQEADFACANIQMSTPCKPGNTPVTSASVSTKSKLNISSQTPSGNIGSPFHNYSSRVASPATRSFSPGVSHLTHMATLRLVKFEEIDVTKQWIFGNTSSISALDAEALPDLNLIIIVDINFTLSLYTGTIKETAIGYYRLQIPEITVSKTVSKCLQALKYILPRDVYTQIFIKWYCSRNAPGPSDLDTKSELNVFLMSLLGMIGFDIDRIILGDCIRNKSNHLAQIKKLKTHEKGCDDDCKLDVSLWNDLSQMNSFLSELARELRQYKYLDHYWQDFPEQFASVSKTFIIPENDLQKVHYPSFFSAVPSIYKCIKECLMFGVTEPFPYIPNVTKMLHGIILIYALLTSIEKPVSSIKDYLLQISGLGRRDLSSLQSSEKNRILPQPSKSKQDHGKSSVTKDNFEDGLHHLDLETGIHKEKHKSPSYQIREGDNVNVDVTSPGATLALGMMFFDSDNQYHLQAFYHLYVLAVEPRLIIPRLIDSNKPVYVNIKVKFKISNFSSDPVALKFASCFLAPAATSDQVSKINNFTYHTFDLWQVKMVSAYEKWIKRYSSHYNDNLMLLRPDFGLSISSSVERSAKQAVKGDISLPSLFNHLRNFNLPVSSIMSILSVISS
ncbi:Anaphase-promoting complex subunit 1 like protein [Argiope bruennichi]|uniref:Anaphase-promoting complex subunit 1 like protein n=1 Tax=Argiope bruennichi TaxID=94029 RepID=A0A8T0EEY7_ARGBR|nr:Anaphase-promoting complex subunit 1 like protein [Argiope bruennichi]